MKKGKGAKRHATPAARAASAAKLAAARSLAARAVGARLGHGPLRVDALRLVHRAGSGQLAALRACGGGTRVSERHADGACVATRAPGRATSAQPAQWQRSCAARVPSWRRERRDAARSSRVRL